MNLRFKMPPKKIKIIKPEKTPFNKINFKTKKDLFKIPMIIIIYFIILKIKFHNLTNKRMIQKVLNFKIIPLYIRIKIKINFK
jgi:hypothetical protein